MATPTDPQPDVPVSTDLPCQQCGYNLRTLSRAGRCPECSLAVEASILAWQQRAAPKLYMAGGCWRGSVTSLCGAFMIFSAIHMSQYFLVLLVSVATAGMNAAGNRERVKDARGFSIGYAVPFLAWAIYPLIGRQEQWALYGMALACVLVYFVCMLVIQPRITSII